MQPTTPANRFISIWEWVPFMFLLVFAACSYTAPYSQFAYEQTISLKVEALQLMDKATEPYASHAADVRNLETNLEKAYEYAKGRPKNEISAKQWQILIDPDRNLLGGFLKRWKTKSTLSPTFINEAKGLVSDAFDTISGLESGKINSSRIQ